MSLAFGLAYSFERFYLWSSDFHVYFCLWSESCTPIFVCGLYFKFSFACSCVHMTFNFVSLPSVVKSSFTCLEFRWILRDVCQTWSVAFNWPKEFTFPPHVSILPYCCPFMIKYWCCVSISTWSWRQNQNYESVYSSWINVWWFFCHSIDKVQCKQVHCRCVCILETERTGSGECHLLLFKEKWT